MGSAFIQMSRSDTAALKLWLSYRFGLPKQQIDITSNGENIAPPIQWITKQIEFKDAEQIEFESLTSKEAQQIESFGADPQTDKIFI